MARYIDADKIDYTLIVVGADENAGYRAIAFESDIDDLPTACVVPKHEVDYARQCGYESGIRAGARKVFEEIEREINDLEYQANTPRKTVKVEELKAQMDWVLHEVVPQILAEIKKKYTEDKT